jgi:hypothetical protein
MRLARVRGDTRLFLAGGFLRWAAESIGIGRPPTVEIRAGAALRCAHRKSIPLWRGIRGHGKFEAVGLVPNLDRFNECTRGEHAIPLCARTTDPHFGTNGTGDASTEDPLRRWRNLRKGDHLLPDLFRWGLNVDCGANNKSGGVALG